MLSGCTREESSGWVEVTERPGDGTQIGNMMALLNMPKHDDLPASASQRRDPVDADQPAQPTKLQQRIRAVAPPRPVLDRQAERGLTVRQREVLQRLGEVFEAGFSDLTMADLAARANCSLRTLYGLAPTRDELVLTVVDRNLWRVGRSARNAMSPDMQPLDAIRAYLSVANSAVSHTSEEFARDLDAMPAARRLRDDHAEYLIAMTKCLLDFAVERGDIATVDTAVVARVIASLGRDFARPEVIPRLSYSPKEAADVMIGVILRGLTTTDSQTVSKSRFADGTRRTSRAQARS